MERWKEKEKRKEERKGEKCQKELNSGHVAKTEAGKGGRGERGEGSSNRASKEKGGSTIGKHLKKKHKLTH